jgi:lysophospholipase L1-like esterase
VNKFCILGNSVATSRRPEDSPMAGWGQYVQEFLGPGYEVKNYARDAMTLRGYFTDRFVKLLNILEPGDFVAIDFGAVEQRVNVPLRYHGPREFKEYLKLYVEAIRGEGAVPVVVTPAARCVFDVHGNVSETHDGYPQYARDAAAETGAVLVDLNELTTRMLHQLGCTRARGLFRWEDAGAHPNHPEGIIDSTHFNELGAREVARLFAGALRSAPGIAPGVVDAEKLITGDYPPVLPEFTVQNPESALVDQGRVGAPPVITSPVHGRMVSGQLKFAGTAEPGTTYLLFFTGAGEYIGGTSVNAQGQWMWRRVVSWPAGEHVVQAVGLHDRGMSPVAAVGFVVRDHVEAPQVLGPREGAWSGPRPRFSGTAAQGVSKVMLLESGRLIAEAAVKEDGTWSVKHPHDWKPGVYTVEFVSVFSALRSSPAALTLKVHGIPESNWLRESALARHDCGSACEHLPHEPSW